MTFSSLALARKQTGAGSLIITCPALSPALPRDRRRLGFSQPPDKQTLRFWLAPEEGAQGCGGTSQDSRTDRLALTSPQLPRLARRDGCPSRRATETYASHQHRDHDERLRR